MSHTRFVKVLLELNASSGAARPPRSITSLSNMKAPTRLTSQALPRLFVTSRTSCLKSQPIASRALHYSAADPANVAPFCATGPPPEPPQPAAEHPYAKAERRRKQAELLKNAKELRDASSSNSKSPGKSPLKKRFWQDVHIKEVDGAQTADYSLLLLRSHNMLTGATLAQAPTRSTSTPGPSATRRPRQ